MNIYGLTDTGVVRRVNQDSFEYGSIDDKVFWSVVCDGMGGANGGDYASRTAVEEMKKVIDLELSADSDIESAKETLLNAINTANIRVYEDSQTDFALAGMGTTVVAAVVIDNDLLLAHSGDSRAYIISNKEIRRATNDHSLVQEMVDNGEITEEEARIHPRRNVITRALGVDDNIKIDFSVHTLRENEAVLLCSDGLTNFIEEQDILEMFCNLEPETLTQALVDRANDNGGGDNITAVIMCQAQKKED